MKKVYLCFPFDGKNSLEDTDRYVKYAILCGAAPVAPHLYAHCVDCSSCEDRQRICEAGQSLLWFCDELWVFGDILTPRMAEEIRFCESLNIRINYVNEKEVCRITGGAK